MRAQLKHTTILSALTALTACGQSERDFYADSQSAESSPTSASGATTDNMASSGGGMSSSAAGGETQGATLSSGNSAGGGSSSTAVGGGGGPGASSNTDASTTGHPNDPECPEAPPEPASACLVMVGLSCTYAERTCVCSGITWNGVGGDAVDTTGATAGALTTTGTFGSMGSNTDGETNTTTGSESPYR